MTYPTNPSEFWAYLEECRFMDSPPAKGTAHVRANSAVISLALDAVDPDEEVLDFGTIYRTMYGRPVKMVYAIMRWLHAYVDPDDWKGALLSWSESHPKTREGSNAA